MTEREQREILRRNLEAHGGAVELVKLMEECGELTQAAAKMLAPGKIWGELIGHLAEEMADVEILMEQVRMYIPELREREETWIQRKLMRMKRMNR